MARHTPGLRVFPQRNYARPGPAVQHGSPGAGRPYAPVSSGMYGPPRSALQQPDQEKTGGRRPGPKGRARKGSAPGYLRPAAAHAERYAAVQMSEVL
ncbi:hypothetical protein ACE1SV_28830 [Streptomyces sennicomposti]